MLPFTNEKTLDFRYRRSLDRDVCIAPGGLRYFLSTAAQAAGVNLGNINATGECDAAVDDQHFAMSAVHEYLGKFSREKTNWPILRDGDAFLLQGFEEGSRRS